jgi:hypothetical protein
MKTGVYHRVGYKIDWPEVQWEAIREDNGSGCKIVVNNGPEPECKIGEDVNSGNDFPHRQGGNRRQGMVK